jgi:uncharacterized protein (DUF433 family)
MTLSSDAASTRSGCRRVACVFLGVYGPEYRRRHHTAAAATTKTPTQYQHLEPRPGSNYRQLFLKGRRIRAAVVDEAIHGPDPRTPEEFARDYQVPLEAVLEALDYVAQNRPLIEQERDREAAKLRARGFDGPAQG